MKRDTMTEAVLRLAPSLQFMGETTEAGQTTMKTKPHEPTKSTSGGPAKAEPPEGR